MNKDYTYNSYKRYKKGTATFSTWLAETALYCGEKLADIRPATDNKRRKCHDGATSRKSKAKQPQAKAQEKYEIPIQQYVSLAKAVAGGHGVIVPSDILTLLDDVIVLRKEVSQWIGKTVSSHCSHSPDHCSHSHHDGHRYFVRILEQVREILRPRKQAPLQPRNGDRKESVRNQNLANTFETLHVEEPTDKVRDQRADPSTTNQTKDLQSPGKIHDVMSLHDEVLVASILFLQDIERFRHHTRSIWSEVRKGAIALETASLLTNTAMELIQGSTEEDLDLIRKWDDAPSESDLIHWVYAHTCQEINKREKPDDLINMETYKEAERISWPVQCMLDNWMRRLEFHRLSMMRQKPLVSSKDHWQMEPREKLEEDERFINCFASEVHNAGILQVPFPPAIDEVSRALGEVHKTKKIPLWLVFAVQLVLDIKGVLRKDIQTGFNVMQDTGHRVKSVVQTHFRTARGLLWRKETWHSNNDGQILRLIGFVAEWVNADIITVTLKRHSKQDIEKAGIEPAPFWLLKNHPLLCGLMVYYMNISIRELGISVSNAYDTILSASHLYNAAKQSGLLSQPWPDMEYLISVHTAKRLFVGGLPTTPGDLFKRFQLATGASPV